MPTAGTWKVPFKGKFSPYDNEGSRMVPAFSISSRQKNTTVNKPNGKMNKYLNKNGFACYPIKKNPAKKIKIFLNHFNVLIFKAQTHANIT